MNAWTVWTGWGLGNLHLYQSRRVASGLAFRGWSQRPEGVFEDGEEVGQGRVGLACFWCLSCPFPLALIISLPAGAAFIQTVLWQ